MPRTRYTEFAYPRSNQSQGRGLLEKPAVTWGVYGGIEAGFSTAVPVAISIWLAT